MLTIAECSRSLNSSASPSPRLAPYSKSTGFKVLENRIAPPPRLVDYLTLPYLPSPTYHFLRRLIAFSISVLQPLLHDNPIISFHVSTTPIISKPVPSCFMDAWLQSREKHPSKRPTNPCQSALGHATEIHLHKLFFHRGGK